MEIWRTQAELRQLDDLRSGRPLVLVPTMGALHEGHLSLVRLGLSTGPVVVSIFVNPAQFGPGEDIASYPRDLQRDLDLLSSLQVAGVFSPDVSEMYSAPDGVSIRPGRRAAGLCGERRPEHFAGVLTVVAKLFGVVKPDVAIFGRKDAQQCLVIDQMVQDLFLPVRLWDGPTVREADGLAMSSRNRYLDPDQRRRAGCLYAALESARRLLEQGERDSSKLGRAMRGALVAADELEYAEVRTVPELERIADVKGRILLAVAAKVGPARLIDNMVLDIQTDQVAESHLLGR